MKRNNSLPLVWFMLGFGIFTFTRMSKIVPTIPIAILIAPIFIWRIIAQMDSAEAGDGILYAEVPTRGVNTIYTTLGDLLGWLTVLGLGTFIVFSVISRERRKGVLSRRPVFD